ncbi:hypothetical protein HYQ46_013101 [Verticillium longisporum]|nr:hypothetical protein HYQ46_013101 [Verticillium longisporum]
MRMVIIVTYRPDEMTPDEVHSIVNSTEPDDFSRTGRPTITRIALAPLSEIDIVHYVAATHPVQDCWQPILYQGDAQRMLPQ